MNDFRSPDPEIVWPVLPAAGVAQLFALLYQFEHSEWDNAAAIAARQREQLLEILAHARHSVPHYRSAFSAFGKSPDALLDAWAEIPILTRDNVHDAGTRLHSSAVPKAHGAVNVIETSGSTGTPIRALMTGTVHLFNYASALREHIWHARDARGTLVAIRPDRDVDADTGQRGAGWGRPLDMLFETGPSALLNSRADIDHQLDWLAAQQPTYLLSLPSNLRALVLGAQARRIALPDLRGVRCYGETVSPALRELCREVWDVPLTDIYSAQEIGNIALQCPDHEHYHVQSETVLVEVLDAAGRACSPGTIGRVVLTTLHNFAMPLVRYEIMDYAEVGAPCPCGRGLPTITRFLGRSRNLATAPNGQLFWPSFAAETWMHIAPIRQVQFVQHTREHICVNYVMDRALSENERRLLADTLHASLRPDFVFSFERHTDPLMRAESGKFEDFVSRL